MNHILRELRDDFWASGFDEGKRTGVMEDGHYHPQTDRDFLCMYCGGLFQ